MSLTIPKLLNRSLPIASAALLMLVGVAHAADRTSNTQQQTNPLPLEPTATHSVQASRPGDGKSADRMPDAQEYARRLLLGSNGTLFRDARTTEPETEGATPNVEHQKHAQVYGDAQAAAQQLLLGQHQTSLPSATGKSKPENRPVVHGDAQLAAQQLLLGAHPASDASPDTARSAR